MHIHQGLFRGPGSTAVGTVAAACALAAYRESFRRLHVVEHQIGKLSVSGATQVLLAMHAVFAPRWCGLRWGTLQALSSFASLGKGAGHLWPLFRSGAAAFRQVERPPTLALFEALSAHH